jgi:hypothetical protein
MASGSWSRRDILTAMAFGAAFAAGGCRQKNGDVTDPNGTVLYHDPDADETAQKPKPHDNTSRGSSSSSQ